MLKKEKRQNLVNSTLSCVQSAPDFSLSYLRLTPRPQAVVYGWRQGAVHGADPGYPGGEGGGGRGRGGVAGRKRQIFPANLWTVSWTVEVEQRQTHAARRPTSSRQMSRMNNETGVDDCTELRKERSGTLPSKATHCNITSNPRDAFSPFFVFSIFNTPITNLILAHSLTRRII